MFYPIKLDRVRNLRYGMRAISLIEKKLKKPVSKIDMENMTMEDTAIMIWAGLHHEDKSLTPENVMDLVDEYSNLPTAIQAMGEAFQGAFGEVKEEGKNE